MSFNIENTEEIIRFTEDVLIWIRKYGKLWSQKKEILLYDKDAPESILKSLVNLVEEMEKQIFKLQNNLYELQNYKEAVQQSIKELVAFLIPLLPSSSPWCRYTHTPFAERSRCSILPAVP